MPPLKVLSCRFHPQQHLSNQLSPTPRARSDLNSCFSHHVQPVRTNAAEFLQGWLLRHFPYTADGMEPESDVDVQRCLKNKGFAWVLSARRGWMGCSTRMHPAANSSHAGSCAKPFSLPTLLFSPPYNPASSSCLWRGRRVLCKACSPRGASEFPISSQVLWTSSSARKAAGTTEGVCQQDFPHRNLRQACARRGCSLPSSNKNPIPAL